MNYEKGGVVNASESGTVSDNRQQINWDNGMFWMLNKESGVPTPPAPGSEVPTKSVNLSRTAVTVKFLNQSTDPIEVIWVDHTGNEKRHSLLYPGRTLDQQTGHGHLWRFKRNDETIAFYQANQLPDQNYSIRGGKIPVPKRENSLTGKWKDKDGFPISIEQTGNQAIANPLTADLQHYWDRGIGQIDKTRISMTHVKAGQVAAIEAGVINNKFTRILWDNGTTWLKLDSVVPPTPPMPAPQTSSLVNPETGFYYTIESKAIIGQFLDVFGARAESGTNVTLYGKTGNDNQEFRFVSAGDGFYFIETKLKPDLVLDINNWGTEDQTNITVVAKGQGTSHKNSNCWMPGMIRFVWCPPWVRTSIWASLTTGAILSRGTSFAKT